MGQPAGRHPQACLPQRGRRRPACGCPRRPRHAKSGGTKPMPGRAPKNHHLPAASPIARDAEALETCRGLCVTHPSPFIPRDLLPPATTSSQPSPAACPPPASHCPPAAVPEAPGYAEPHLSPFTSNLSRPLTSPAHPPPARTPSPACCLDPQFYHPFSRSKKNSGKRRETCGRLKPRSAHAETRADTREKDGNPSCRAIPEDRQWLL